MLRLVFKSLHSPEPYRMAAQDRGFRTLRFLTVASLLEVFGYMLITFIALMAARDAFLTQPDNHARRLFVHVTGQMPALTFENGRLTPHGGPLHSIDWPERAVPMIVIDTTSKPKSAPASAVLVLHDDHYILGGKRRDYGSIPDGTYTGDEVRDDVTAFLTDLPIFDAGGLVSLLTVLPVILVTVAALDMLMTAFVAMGVTLVGLVYCGMRGIEIGIGAVYRMAIVALVPAALIGLGATALIGLGGGLYILGWLGTLGIGVSYLVFGLRTLRAT